jgi:hypothetical protein
MTLEEKKAIANAYLNKVANVDWDDLPDINSLHDVEAEEDIIELADARLEEEGFCFDLD